MNESFFELCTRHGVPNKSTVQYDRIYAYDVCTVPVKDIFAKYFNNRGGREREGNMNKHIKDIANAIVEAGGMEAFPPIIVDINTLTIADGHCRLDAAINVAEAGLLGSVIVRVIFEDIPKEKFDDRVIELNMGQQSWGLLDFIYNYANRGFDSFSKLIKFCDGNELLHDANGKINPRYGGAALMIPVSNLKKPTLTITDSDINTGQEIMHEVAEMWKLLATDIHANGGCWKESFIRAWSEFRDNIGDIDFRRYLSEIRTTIERRKREVSVPYRSHKKQDWNTFFRAVKTYL